jgi:hypothetical protein
MRLHREIILAFIAILLITGIYLGFASHPYLPASSDPTGHSMGITGFLLLLATETLYSIRKRSRRVQWGQMQTWLRIHIFTGIVGPYLILLHSAFHFHGLAGIVALMTGILVFSGFIGRYIYTAVPRTPQGNVVTLEELKQALDDAEKELQKQDHEAVSALPQNFEKISGGIGTVLGRTYLHWRANSAWRGGLRKADDKTREQLRQVDSLRQHRNDLLIQIRTYEIAPRLLFLWRSVHIPLGISLFVASFVHIGAALYYVVLAR